MGEAGLGEIWSIAVDWLNPRFWLLRTSSSARVALEGSVHHSEEQRSHMTPADKTSVADSET